MLWGSGSQPEGFGHKGTVLLRPIATRNIIAMSDTKTPAPVHPLLEGTTPGPWQIEPEFPLEVHAGALIATAEDILLSEEVAMANAKLIAMAPTLAAENARLRAALEALVKAHEWAVSNPDSPVSANINYGHVATDAREVLAPLTT